MYVDIYREPSSERSRIFIDIEYSINYLIRREILPETINCLRCGSLMPIKAKNKSSNGHVYRCPNCLCKKELPLLFNKKMDKLRLPLNDIFLLIYKWTGNRR